MSDDYKKRLTGILEGTELSEDQKAKLEEIFPELKESEDERISKILIRVIKELAKGYDNVAAGLSLQDAVAWLEKKGAKGSGKETPLSVWSDNDHEMVFRIRKIIEKYAFSQSAVDVNGDLCEKEYIDADDWMESLEGRLMQLPKQEWSAEDERLRISCIKHIEDELEEVRNDKYGHSEIISDLKESCRERIKWLESLRPQSHWRPSEEQMVALWNSIPYNVLECSEREKLLDSLYQDLKKLID